MTADSKPIAIDLFAGAGGFSLAARRAGMDVKLAVEIDRHACQTYKDNLIPEDATSPLLIEDDIRNVDWDVDLRRAGVAPGECSILLGGPPCQGYSTHRINDAGVDDPRNELLFAYFDCLEKIRPHAFLVENVPGLLWSRHADYLNKFISRAKKEYSVFEPIAVNARDYGVPQNRKRIFILGFRAELPAVPIEWPPPKTHFPPSSSDVVDDGKKPWMPASTVFEKALKKSDLNGIHMNHGPDLIAVFKKTPKNGGSRRDSGRILKCHEKHDGHKDVYGRIDPRVPGPTMTTACINPSKGRFVHPTEDHGITARHAARFQTFPEQFDFSGGLIASGQQIGNAVPVLLGTCLIRHIVAALAKVKGATRRCA
jgi:DNA (cytosine-5)-methyltransferase 1